MPERRGGVGHKLCIRLKQYNDTPMMKHRREEQVSFLHDRAGYKLRHHQRNISRQKFNMFYLNNELKHAEKNDFLLTQKWQ